MNARKQQAVRPRTTRISQMLCCRGSRVGCNRLSTINHQLPVRRSFSTRRSFMRTVVCEGGSAINQSSGFALVVALIMVALMAVIAVGVLTTVSVERGTATSYSSRYQADRATQNGLQAAAKTLAAAPFPSPVPVNFSATVSGNDAFLVVRADGPANANGNKAAYYYLAQPSTGANPTVTYYPLFSASTDPSDPSVIQTATI